MVNVYTNPLLRKQTWKAHASPQHTTTRLATGLCTLCRSAYMLAVAAYRDKVDVGSPEEQERKARRTWAQGLAEQTGCPTDSVDLYVLSFVMHEMPTNAIIGMLRRYSSPKHD